MTTPLFHSLQKAVSEIDTVLYIGAGRCDDFSDYAALSVNAFFLVEPNPDYAMPLRRLAKKDARVSVLPCAVSGADTLPDQATLHIWNNTAFNSLHMAPGLDSQLPGLRETAQVGVNVLGVAQLLEQVPLSENGRHILRLEALGENTRILKALVAGDQIGRFEHILLRSSQDSLLGEDETAEATVQYLEEVGFHLCATEDLGLGLSALHLKRKPCRAVPQDLAGRLDEALANLQAAETKSAKHKAKCDAVLIEATAQAEALQALQVELATMTERAKTAEETAAQHNEAFTEVTAKLEAA
ncbi:MAG: hypothetical protein GY892_12660, partial [Shimia sp.]|nr:hypothetical protein [Shimia sp.]